MPLGLLKFGGGEPGSTAIHRYPLMSAFDEPGEITHSLFLALLSTIEKTDGCDEPLAIDLVSEDRLRSSVACATASC